MNGDTMTISTRDLSRLPAPRELERALRSMATLDAILFEDWEDRYYSFDSKWDGTERLASMRNGQGDEFFALFKEEGVFFKGFVHDCPVAGDELVPDLDGLPSVFAGCLAEPAFQIEDRTFCLWRLASDASWSVAACETENGEDPDGSGYLLSPLDGHPEIYRDWAEEYLEDELDLDAIRVVFRHEPLTGALVRRLNPESSLAEIRSDLEEIGYPWA